MFPGPVFYSELRRLARRRRFYALRFGFGLLLLYFVVQTYNSLRWMFSSVDGTDLTVSETAVLGTSLYGTVFWLQSIAVLFLTPALLAGTIAEDRQRRVLAYLLASPLNAAEIVLGKVAARLLSVVVIVASCFPIVSIALLFGGIDPVDLAMTYAGTFSAILFLAGVSVAVSTLTEKPREAILRAYFLVLFWLAWPALDMAFRYSPAPYSTTYQWIAPVLDWFTDSSPTRLLELNTFRGGASYVEPVLWMIGLQLLYGSLLLLLATFRLRPLERGARLLRRGDALRASAVRRLWGRRPCSDRPMIWKECSGTIIVRNLATATLSGIILTAAACALAYGAVRLGGPALAEVREFGYSSAFGNTYDARELLNVFIRILTAVLYVMMLFTLAGSAATSFTIEREKDAWISLLATPLEGDEIILGKTLGAMWRARFVIGLMIAVWAFGVVCGAVHPLAFLLVVVLTAVDAAFTTCLGCYVSLRMSSSARAIALTIGVLLFLKGGYLIICAPFFRQLDTSVLLAGVTPFFVTASAGTYSDVQRFFGDGHRQWADWATGCLACLIVHGLAIVVLAWSIRERFEVEADRPDASRADSRPAL